MYGPPADFDDAAGDPLRRRGERRSAPLTTSRESDLKRRCPNKVTDRRSQVEEDEDGGQAPAEGAPSRSPRK
jgi:hypothetical protein